ncbi:hypothetical protein ACWPKO_17335 [Coraliomargarita sp. W4R53]
MATLEFKESEFDFAAFASGKAITTPLVDGFFEVFVHEYTHFLQNVTTCWGVLNVCEYASAVITIGCGRVAGDSEMIQKGYDLRNGISERLIQSKSVSESSGQPLTAFLFTKENLVSVVDVKAIRENMARCVAELYLGKGDEAIHVSGESFTGFHTTEARWCLKLEYWVIFEYFYHHGFQRVAEGVLKLCVHLLSYEFPEQAFSRFLDAIYEEAPCDLWDAVEVWFQSDTERAARTAFHQVLRTRLRALVDIGIKHGELIDIVKELGAFCGFILESLDCYGGIFLDRIEEMKLINFWAEKVQITGSPVLRFNDNTLIWGATISHQQALINLSGVTEVMQRLGQDRFSCRFYEEFPICTADKDFSLCGSKPYHSIDQDTGCLFCNSMKALGMTDSKDWGSDVDIAEGEQQSSGT